MRALRSVNTAQEAVGGMARAGARRRRTWLGKEERRKSGSEGRSQRKTGNGGVWGGGARRRSARGLKISGA